MSKFLQQDVLLSLLQVRQLLDGKDKKEIARKHFGCYGVDRMGFVSRSALKLADLVSVVTQALQDKMPDLKGVFNGHEQDLSFIDLYGGAGGFSDLMLYKHGSSIKRWWLLKRRDKKPPNLVGFKAFAEERATTTSYNPMDAAEVDASDLDAMAAFLASTGAEANPVSVVFGDGTIDVKTQDLERKPRTIELASMPYLWCQAWSALGVLRVGGTFICKVTDSLGRCSVGTVFLLCQCFKFATIIKPSMTSPAKCERFLVALDFLGPQNEMVVNVRAHLAHVLRVSASVPESDDVVEIIPTGMILREPFLNRVTKLNER